MAKNEVKINIFVASPSDLDNERNLLDLVCTELNKIWGDWLGLNLNLIRWETDVYPNISEYPQNAINEQISNDFDVFIAMFWNRFGTPTRKAKSGTLEELELALHKYKNDSNAIDIMIYFKNQTLEYSDKKQQEKVLDLKRNLPNRGVLYWEFDDTKDFESLLRIHLSKVAQKWSKKDLFNNQKKKNKVLDKEIELQLNEYYFLLSGKTGLLAVVHNNILTALELFLNKQNQTIELLKDSNNSSKVLDVFAFIMEDVSSILDNHIQLLEKSRKDVFNILSKVVSLEIGLKYSPRLDNIISIVNPWLESHPHSIKEIEYMGKYLMLFPDITKDFSFIRNKMYLLLNHYCRELDKELFLGKNILNIIYEHKSN